MKAISITLTEKTSTVVYSFFNSRDEKFLVNVVSFENGYKVSIGDVANELANQNTFSSYKDEKGFKNTWGNKKRMDFINNNIERLPCQWFN